MSQSVVLIKQGEDGRALSYAMLEEMGALEVLSSGSKVLVKPNITADRPASTGVVTHPSIVEGVLQFLKDHGIEDIILGEGAGTDVTRAFSTLGFEEVARRYGAKLADFNREEEVLLSVPEPLRMKQFGMARTVTQCDAIINLPCLKIHSGESQVTLCMKNMMGCLARNRGIMHENFDEKIVDLLKVVKPSLNLIDGLVGMERQEISGDPVGMNVVIGSRDFVAADAVGAAVMGFEDGEVGHIQLAGKLGLGTAGLRDIEIRGAPVESVRRSFRRWGK